MSLTDTEPESIPITIESSGSEQSEPLLLEDEQEDDDLEIPAFLRRQKN